MPKACANLRELKPITCTNGEEPILGFVVLRAVNDVIDRHGVWHDPVEYESGFTVSLQLRGVDLSLTSETGGAISTGRYYRSLLLAVGSPDGSDFEIRSAISLFVAELHHFVAIERAEPIPELRRRVCQFDREIVVWDEDLQLWNCQDRNHGLIFEDETVEAMTNPFYL